MRVAILDDYQGVAKSLADWSVLPGHVDVQVFRDHIEGQDALARRLQPFDIIVGMRERTPFPRGLLERLPNLKLLITTGASNASFDVEAATGLGIVVAGTEGSSETTGELAWGLIIAVARQIPQEDRATRAGRWQVSVGHGLRGKTLGILGLGRIGSQMAGYAHAFGMPVIAWSQNLTAEQASKCGAALVSKDELFTKADIVTIHLRLSARTRNLVTARELALMKPTAYLVNTSRGPIVNEAALIDALRRKAIAGAALDVFDQEPLPANHPLLSLENAVITPHLGYVTHETYRGMYGNAIEDIQSFLAGKPARVINPQVLERPNLRRLG